MYFYLKTFIIIIFLSHFIIQNHTNKDNSVTESLENIEDKIVKKKKSQMTTF